MYEKEHFIKLALDELDLCHNYKGYNYLAYGLLQLLGRKELLTCITKGLYANIATYYNVTTYSVERNIRTAIQVIWEKNKGKSIFKEYDNCPSNGECIDLLLYEIEKRMV